MPSRNTRRQWRLTIPMPLVSEQGEDDRAGKHLDLWTVELPPLKTKRLKFLLAS